MKFNGRRPKMNQFIFSIFLVTVAAAGSLHNATGQAINATMQTAAPRGAPLTAAKSVATARVAPQFAPRLTGFNPPRFNGNLPRIIAQPAINPQHSYSPIVRNPAFAGLYTQRNATGPQTIALDSATQQTELRTL